MPFANGLARVRLIANGLAFLPRAFENGLTRANPFANDISFRVVFTTYIEESGVRCATG